jgi:hypothetical protein
MQGAAAEQDRDHQPIGLQRPAALDKLPDRIAGPMERQRMNDKVMRLCPQVKDRIVGHDARAVEPTLPHLRETRHHGGRGKPFVNLAQSLLDLVRNLFVQEQLGSLTKGAGTTCKKGRAVGKLGRMGHDR